MIFHIRSETATASLAISIFMRSTHCFGSGKQIGVVDPCLLERTQPLAMVPLQSQLKRLQQQDTFPDR